jgi:hypothetical protein
MAVTYQSISAVAHGSGGTATTNAPSGVSVGDLLLLFLGTQTSAASTTPGSGTWAIAKAKTGVSQAQVEVFWKIADGTADDTPSITLNGSNDWQTYIVRCTGHHATVPIGDSDSNNGTGTTVAVTPITVSDAGSLVFLCTQTVLTSDTISSFPSGYTSMITTALTGRGAFGIARQAFSVGDTPAGNITYAGTGSQKSNLSFEVVPAAGGGGGSIVPLVMQLAS